MGVMSEDGDTSSAAAETSRLTPYELLVSEAVEVERFPAIREEAAVRGVNTLDPEQFVLLASAGSLVRELLPDRVSSGDEAEESGRRPLRAGPVQEVGRLVYHAFHFWRLNKPLLLAPEALVRWVVRPDRAPEPNRFQPPAEAGYVQLPRQLLWSSAEAGTSEAVDGFFWTVAKRAGNEIRSIAMLFCLGLRPGRPGFSVVGMEEAMPPGGVAGWAQNRVRQGGADFSNVLPGGELKHLLALTTWEEALKLVDLLFGYVASHPDAVGEGESAPDVTPGAREMHEMPPSHLPYRRLLLRQAKEGEQRG